MLFLVISDPRPEPPTGIAASRQRFWTWVDPLITAGRVRSIHAKVGRGAVALFDVDFERDASRLLECVGRHHSSQVRNPRADRAGQRAAIPRGAAKQTGVTGDGR